MLKNVEMIGDGVMENAGTRVKQILDVVMSGYNRKKYAKPVDNVVFFGHGVSRALNQNEKEVTENHLGRPVIDQAVFYHKATVNFQMFMSINYCRKRKRNNSFVRLSDGNSCQIVSFASVSCCDSSKHIMSFVKRCVSRPRFFMDCGQSRCQIEHIMSVTSDLTDLTAVDMSELVDKYVMYRKSNDSYILCLLPNNLERD